jgi:ribonuclease HI
MPWIEAMLRGQKVFARVRADGAFDAEGGRVEIRYKKSDPRAYRASASNLASSPGATLIADDEVVAGETVAERTPAKAGTSKKAAAIAAVKSADLRDAWVAYADGACSGNPGPAGAGFVVVHPGGRMEEGFEFLGHATNNVAELTAILRALEASPKGAPQIVVHTDSQYAIGVLSKGWKPKTNHALIDRTKAALAARPRARLVYVPGHSGVPLNERADELAREAVRSGKTQPIAAGE